MGYRGHERWHDMPDFLVHFTKPIPKREIGQPPQPPAQTGRLTLEELIAGIEFDGRRDRTGYSPWIKILGSGRLKPGIKPLGLGRTIPQLSDRHRVVCFSEIPLDMLDRLIKRRSLYGVGFRKDFIVARGGAPLWYLDKESEQGKLVYELMRSKGREGVDPSDPFWQLSPFIDNPGNYRTGEYRFEWEREWRVVGEFQFEPHDVSFLFLPEENHAKARQFFADVKLEYSGPAYECAYVDPRWDMERIQDALTNVQETPPPSPGVVPWWADSV
jgi:Putative abortive phage resistance protein AbiGi, antitoxin